MESILLSAILVNLSILFVSFSFVLHALYPWKIVWIIFSLHLLVAIAPIIAFEDQYFSESAVYLTPFFFTSSAIWDSRSFIIDKFHYLSCILSRPFYVTIPICVIAVSLFADPVISLNLHSPLILIEISMGVLLPEAAYSIMKRTRTLSIQTPRRGSIQRLSAMSSVSVTPMNAPRTQFNHIRIYVLFPYFVPY